MGEKGKNINDDIGELVKKGLDPVIQQALDVVRVVGNNAVHPGQLDMEDNVEIATSLFELINVIAEAKISVPKRIKNAYNSVVPDGARQAIAKRDNQTAQLS